MRLATGLPASLRLELAFGRAAEVRGDHHGRALGQRVLDARQRGADAGVVGDGEVVVLDGTLRSARMKTRLPATSRSVRRLKVMAVLDSKLGVENKKGAPEVPLLLGAWS
jgi:hypothetical protein